MTLDENNEEDLAVVETNQKREGAGS